MARKPARKPAGRSPRPASAGATAAPATPTTDREKIVAAFLTLLADERFESIGLADVEIGKQVLVGSVAVMVEAHRLRTASHEHVAVREAFDGEVMLVDGLDAEIGEQAVL